MLDPTMKFKKISGETITTNHMKYVPQEGMVIIYLHTCRHPETKEVLGYYVGSTDGPLKDRVQKLFSGYHYSNTITKFMTYLLKYGCAYIESTILWVVPAEERAKVEQEEIDRYNALSLGFNSIRAVKKVLCPAKKYNNGSKASEKNTPTEVSVESYQISCRHQDGSASSVTINKGFYEHYFSSLVLCLDTPGMKGQLTAHPKIDGKRTSKTVLRYLSEDLGINLKFGPEGCHMITLDNLYLVGTRTSLRTFLDQNPIYIKKVSYLTFGEWDSTEDNKNKEKENDYSKRSA